METEFGVQLLSLSKMHLNFMIDFHWIKSTSFLKEASVAAFCKAMMESVLTILQGQGWG
jgi:hypothetical protein